MKAELGFGLAPNKPLDALRTAENEEGVDAPGPASKPRADADEAVDEARFVARGVNPRRVPD